MLTRLSRTLVVLLSLSILIPLFITSCGDDDVVNSPAGVASTISILFISDRDGTDRIYGMNTNGSYQTPLVPDGAIYMDPAWSPDGTRFACVTVDDGRWHLSVVDMDSLTPTHLALAPVDIRSPVWSPDGSMIAFVTGSDGNTEISAVSADGSSIFNVTSHVGDDLRPAWHPDGSMISYASYNTGTGSWETRWIMADGSFTAAKIYTTGCGGSSGWSPDGTRYFRCSAGGNQEAIHVEDSGAAAGSLFSAERIDSPRWLPDGSALLMSIPPVLPGTYEVSIWGPSGLWSYLTDDDANNTQPDCNEAMTRIAFRSDRDGNEEIYRMNFDGTGQYNLTNNAARDWSPKWRPGH